MTDRAWKAFERRLARALGTRRIPVTGERHGADFRDARCAYQAKLGRRCPAYLRDWLAGIQASSAVGVVVWKPKGAKDADALVVLRFTDWCALTPRTAPTKSLTTFPGHCERCGEALGTALRGHGNAHS